MAASLRKRIKATLYVALISLLPFALLGCKVAPRSAEAETVVATVTPKAIAPLPTPSTNERYDRILSAVLVSEGYTYTNIPGDKGGPTKYGITIYDVRQYLKPHATAADVRALTLEQAKTIYKLHYWNAVGGDSLPAGLDYTVFDFAVNAGPRRAMDTLQRCRLLEEAELKPSSTIGLIKCVNDRRMAFQMGLPASQDKFKRGWRNRITAVRTISLSMAGETTIKAGLIDLYSIPRIGFGKAYMEEPNAN